ncbi:MAG: transcriptional regulator [Gammaproteobacteria bacterium]|nr:transcriptional regulator [Gammaproteobacteria bacterium]
MNVKPIRTKSDYRAALKTVETLMTAKRGTPAGERLDVLVTLIEAYEDKHHPIPPPDPVEAIKFEMERKGITAKDLEPMIGRRNRVYEILNRKRPLTLKMIRRLHAQLGIPVDILIKETETMSATYGGAG